MRLEDRDGLAALDEEGFVVPEALQGLDDSRERVPVPCRLPRAAVDDELGRLLRVLEVVLEHAEDRLLSPSPAPQLWTASRPDFLHRNGHLATGPRKAFSTAHRAVVSRDGG